MDESVEQTLARLQRYSEALKRNPRVGTSQSSGAPLPPATGPELVVFGSGGHDDLTPEHRGSAANRTGGSPIIRTATGQLVALAACVCSIALFAVLSRPIAVGISAGFAILGGLATWRGIPMARWWTVGVLIGGTLGMLS